MTLEDKIYFIENPFVENKLIGPLTEKQLKIKKQAYQGLLSSLPERQAKRYSPQLKVYTLGGDDLK
jgi:hypothetical protein